MPDTAGTRAAMAQSGLMSTEKTYELLVDCEKKAVACVLLQAAYGCDPSLLHRFGFQAVSWLVVPTKGMRKIRGTEAQWRKAAEIVNKPKEGK